MFYTLPPIETLFHLQDLKTWLNSHNEVEKVDLVLRIRNKLEAAESLASVEANTKGKLRNQLNLLLQSLPGDLRGVLVPSMPPLGGESEESLLDCQGTDSLKSPLGALDSNTGSTKEEVVFEKVSALQRLTLRCIFFPVTIFFFFEGIYFQENVI